MKIHSFHHLPPSTLLTAGTAGLYQAGDALGVQTSRCQGGGEDFVPTFVSLCPFPLTSQSCAQTRSRLPLLQPSSWPQKASPSPNRSEEALVMPLFPAHCRLSRVLFVHTLH